MDEVRVFFPKPRHFFRFSKNIEEASPHLAFVVAIPSKMSIINLRSSYGSHFFTSCKHARNVIPYSFIYVYNDFIAIEFWKPISYFQR